MTAADVALVISAATAAVTALGGLILALSVFLPTLRASRKAVEVAEKAVARTEENTVAVAAVHTIVNQQRTDQLNYEAVLKALVLKLGGEVPDDQSIARTTASRDER